MSDYCYLCFAPGEQICIVCERSICQQAIAPDILPGDAVVCRECHKITPDRRQAQEHFWLRQTLKLEQMKKGNA